MNRFDLFPNNDLMALYRQVFSTGPGLEVLNHILFELGAFQEFPCGETETALRNYSSRLLAILAGGEVGKESIETFTKQLMRQPLSKEQHSE